jgi:hypothetical protein
MMTAYARTCFRKVAAMALLASTAACTTQGGVENRAWIDVSVCRVDQVAIKDDCELDSRELAFGEYTPFPVLLADETAQWTFSARLDDGRGNTDTSYNGTARITVVPGALTCITTTPGEPCGEDGSTARNIRFVDGIATGVAHVTGVFDDARLWVQDIGYQRPDQVKDASCANGLDDDGDGLVDFPADPGCAFADDNSEGDSTFLTGVSQAIDYRLPTLADVQGEGSQTPYTAVAVEVEAGNDPSFTVPRYLVVTRVSSDGFYVSDLNTMGAAQFRDYGHMFAFNFNTPEGMRVCDRLTRLSGTVAEFFGFTEINFPSYEVEEVGDDDCNMPTAYPLGDNLWGQSNSGGSNPIDADMEKYESGLVQIEGFSIAQFLGPEPAVGAVFGPNRSNCDLDGDGVVNFLNDAESACSNACNSEPECSEWNSFFQRGNYKVHRGPRMIQINTNSGGFSPLPASHRGAVLPVVRGVLRNFSGGSLNWTVETRCREDLECDFDPSCTAQLVTQTKACVTQRTDYDPDSGTN